MPIKTVEDLFIQELSDAYSAEKQMTKSLPKMARAASDPELAQAFEQHLEETRAQVERIDQVVELTGFKLKRTKCVGMEGLIEEGLGLVEKIDKGLVLDAALIGSAQKVEHYEIASYNTLVTLAIKLDLIDAVSLLKESLQEEQATDEKLSTLAEAIAIEEAVEG